MSTPTYVLNLQEFAIATDFVQTRSATISITLGDASVVSYEVIYWAYDPELLEICGILREAATSNFCLVERNLGSTLHSSPRFAALNAAVNSNVVTLTDVDDAKKEEVTLIFVP